MLVRSGRVNTGLICVGSGFRLMHHGSCRDIGGQKQYRSEWARYTRGCNVIMFVVDTYAVSGERRSLHALVPSFLLSVWLQREQIPVARKELHRLLENRWCAVARLSRKPWLSLALVVGRELATTPIMIVANKIDLEPHISEQDLIRGEERWIAVATHVLAQHCFSQN